VQAPVGTYKAGRKSWDGASDKYIAKQAGSKHNSENRVNAKSIQSQNKLNDYLKKTGYSLQGGKGMQVVGTQKVDMGGRYSTGVRDMRAQRQGGGKQMVNIYGPAQTSKQPKEQSRKPERSSSRGSGRPDASIRSTPASSASQAIQRAGTFDVPARASGAFAQDFLSGRGSSGGNDNAAPQRSASDLINTDSSFYGSGANLRGLADGYPRGVNARRDLDRVNSDWSSSLQQAASSNRGAYERSSDRFAGSRAFRDSLHSIFS